MSNENPPRAPALAEVAEMARTLVAALAIALVLRVVLFQPFTIPSSSMEPGLVSGDYIIVSKWPYGWSRASLPLNPPLPNGRIGGQIWGSGPRRGDVIVFRLPRDPKQAWIKRLVGLPGDRVQVIAGRVVVNGAPGAQQALGPVEDRDAPGRIVPLARETGADGRSWRTYASEPGHEGFDTGVYVVPQGMYFFMGDNRDNSLDSRWPREVGAGLVPATNLIGRAERVALSWRAGASVLKPWTWLNLDWRRTGLAIG